MGKFVDLLLHLWLPVIIVGMAGTAGLIRVMRAKPHSPVRERQAPSPVGFVSEQYTSDWG